MRIAILNRILGAALCAGLATYATVSWVGSRAPVASSQPPPRTVVVTRDVEPEMRTVIVAAAPLRFGTILTADVLAEVQWPAAALPAGHFSSREALIAAGHPRTVLTAIAKNEPILASKISGPGQRGMLSAVIEDGKKAVTIRVDDVLGVAGFVQPDDRVDILLTRYERPQVQTGRAVIERAFTDLLLQNIRVLAIDQIADRSPQAKPAKAVTVEVATEDAQKLVLGATVGQLSLALRNAASFGLIESRRIGMLDLPGLPPEPSAAPIQERPTGQGTFVTITRGVSERSLYELTQDGRRELHKTQRMGVADNQADQAKVADPPPQME